MKSKNRLKIETRCYELGLKIINLEFVPEYSYSPTAAKYGSDDVTCCGGYWSLKIDCGDCYHTLSTEQRDGVDAGVDWLIEALGRLSKLGQ